jgi:hypothetical protein
MSILNLGGAGPSSPIKSNSKKIILGIGLIVAVLGVGSTLASTITLGTNNTREFGQGVEKTVFCGGSEQTIQVIPTSEFANSDTENSVGSFTIQSIAVTNIPPNCSGVDFIISAYGFSGSSESEGESPSASSTPSSTPSASGPISLLSGADQPLLNVWWNKTCPSAFLDCGAPAAALSGDRNLWGSTPDITQVTVSVDGTSFTINFLGGTGISTDQLSKIVVETQDDVIGKDRGFIGSPSFFNHA